MSKAQVQKAQPKPLTQAYLILTNNKVEFKDRVAIVDLFFPETQMRIPTGEQEPTAEEYKAHLAQLLWTTLMDRGFRINSSLERQYAKQQTCLWCGGAVMTFGNGDPEAASYETRCTDCGYLYDED